MANLEDELARFEAELASVQAPPQNTFPPPPHSSFAPPPRSFGAPQQSFTAPPQPSYVSQNQPSFAAPPQASAPQYVPQYQPAPGPPPVQYHPAQQPYGGQPPPAPYQQMGQGYAPAPIPAAYYPPPDPYAAGAVPSIQPAIPLTRPPDPELAKKLKEDLMGKGKVAHAGKDATKQKTPAVKRHAAGETWWDSTLLEWPENDFRIFVGDLGNEVNDEILTKAFQKYASFAKAKIVRDKRTNKSKGYGFVSLLEGNDFAKALKEMDGKYIGNRPCKLRKSEWTERNAPMKGKRKDTADTGGPAKKSKGILHK